MLDVSGSYGVQFGDYRGRSKSKGVLSTIDVPVRLASYLKYFRDYDRKEEILHTYTITMDEADLEKIKNEIINVTSNSWAQCATEASSVMEKSGAFPDIKALGPFGFPMYIKEYLDELMTDLPEGMQIIHKEYNLNQDHEVDYFHQNIYGDDW